MMKLSIIPICILLSGTIFAQNEIVYSYDNAGNRVKREHIALSIIQSNDLTENIAMENLANSGVDLQAQPNPASEETKVSVLMDQKQLMKSIKLP